MRSCGTKLFRAPTTLSPSAPDAVPGAYVRLTKDEKRTLFPAVGAEGEEGRLQEEWLKTAIARNAELVTDCCLAAGLTDEADWIPWGTEAPVRDLDGALGSMDVLLLSPNGRLGIVETKIGKTASSRRGVVAQILDYARALTEAPRENLANLAAWRDLWRDDSRARLVPAHDEVQDRLARGDFLLIVASDEITDRVVRLGSALLDPAHSTRPWTLAFVEVALLRKTDVASPGELLLAPHLRGVVVQEPRLVLDVRVHDSSQGPLPVRVSVREDAVDPRDRRERKSLDQALEERGATPEQVSIIHEVLDRLAARGVLESPEDARSPTPRLKSCRKGLWAFTVSSTSPDLKGLLFTARDALEWLDRLSPRGAARLRDSLGELRSDLERICGVEDWKTSSRAGWPQFVARFTALDRDHVAPLVDAIVRYQEKVRTLYVTRDDGTREPFDRTRIEESVKRACRGRQLPAERLEDFLSGIERAVRGQANPEGEVTIRQIIELMKSRLRALDKVASHRYTAAYLNMEDYDHDMKEMRRRLLDEPTAEEEGPPGVSRPEGGHT